MKKIIIGVLAALFVICGIGAILLLNKGNEDKETADNTPKIQGVKDISIQVGEKLPETIKDVKTNAAVKDVTIDISHVDTSKPGTYPITYIYVDTKGTEHKKEITCTVTETKTDTATQENGQEPGQKVEDTNTNANTIPPQEAGKLPVPKTGDDWQMAVYIILLMGSCAVITCAGYFRAKKRKI